MVLRKQSTIRRSPTPMLRYSQDDRKSDASPLQALRLVIVDRRLTLCLFPYIILIFNLIFYYLQWNYHKNMSINCSQQLKLQSIHFGLPSRALCQGPCHEPYHFLNLNSLFLILRSPISNFNFLRRVKRYDVLILYRLLSWHGS